MQLQIKTTKKHGIEIHVPIVIFNGICHYETFLSFGLAYQWLEEKAYRLLTSAA